MATQLKVGAQAPDFTLPDADQKLRSLKEFLGRKIVLAFFVSAFTKTCTKEVCDFRDSMDRLVDLDAQIIGISVNDSFSNKEFAQKNRLSFPILSDVGCAVTQRYGLQTHDYEGVTGYVVAKPSLFVLDQKGVIRYIWVSEDPAVEPNYDEVQSALRKLA
jgi:peroxiredoxin